MNMRTKPERPLLKAVLPGLPVLGLLAMAAPLQAADDFASLFTEGKAHAAFRYRLENVDQDAFAEDATASTLRSASSTGRPYQLNRYPPWSTAI